ncbi:unnamed protein product [Arabis nemorensis]|uniref:Uncharacterized protein n=1 Tax=Arabis nemorensis TaxID=586526 RepID=A0A565CB27_9BRAS|nr:unnamed protein product [Arabis nemorensis]
MALSYDQYFQLERARNEGNQQGNDQEYEASAAAAMIAVNLLSSARVILKLDNAFTAYSAKYLVDNACLVKEAGQGETDRDWKEKIGHIWDLC